jgi:hypothetical protein
VEMEAAREEVREAAEMGAGSAEVMEVEATGVAREGAAGVVTAAVATAAVVRVWVA